MSQASENREDDEESNYGDPLWEAFDQMRYIVEHLFAINGVDDQQVFESLVGKGILDPSDKDLITTVAGCLDGFQKILDLVGRRASEPSSKQQQVFGELLAVVGKQKNCAWIVEEIERRQREIVKSRVKYQQMKLLHDSTLVYII